MKVNHILAQAVSILVIGLEFVLYPRPPESNAQVSLPLELDDPLLQGFVDDLHLIMLGLYLPEFVPHLGYVLVVNFNDFLIVSKLVDIVRDHLVKAILHGLDLDLQLRNLAIKQLVSIFLFLVLPLDSSYLDLEVVLFFQQLASFLLELLALLVEFVEHLLLLLAQLLKYYALLGVSVLHVGDLPLNGLGLLPQIFKHLFVIFFGHDFLLIQ